MGHLLGAAFFFFKSRPTVRQGHGGRASGILSIPAHEVSLGSPRVGTIHVQSPTPHAPALEAFLTEFSQAPKAKKRWFWQKEPIPAANPDEKIKPAPAWAVYSLLALWYGVALVLNGTFRSALVQDLGARGAKEAIAAEARMKMGL